MRSAAMAAHAESSEQRARRQVDEWCKRVRLARAEYQKIVGEPAPPWTPNEAGWPTAEVEGVTFTLGRDRASTLNSWRLHVDGAAVRNLAQLGAVIARLDAEGGPRG